MFAEIKYRLSHAVAPRCGKDPDFGEENPPREPHSVSFGALPIVVTLRKKVA